MDSDFEYLGIEKEIIVTTLIEDSDESDSVVQDSVTIYKARIRRKSTGENFFIVVEDDFNPAMTEYHTEKTAKEIVDLLG